ncbi:beta-phosphoglucomutase [Bacillus solitudinis]|uniref:beta-phosphoglucomutase n=1 Tax=Bacillus solitudinis TaxID=2014074 RepID=UPI000C24BD74|nr:beta-phosphoglucomutase [Bacillus solitudinis]
MTKKAIIFDLDGVIVSTDELHYQAWKRISDDEHVTFNRDINERLRGISRLESLNIILEQSSTSYSDQEKLELMERKNNHYRHLLNGLTPENILPGVKTLISDAGDRGLKLAIGSSSKNAMIILEKIDLLDAFDSIVDGNQITNSKPDPEVFLLAAEKLGVSPEECIVIEDAEAGVEAALGAGMMVIGVGPAAKYEKTDVKLVGLQCLDISLLLL